MRSSQAIPELLRVSEMTNRHLKRRQFLDRAAETLIIAFASIAIAIILLIFVYVGREAMPLLWENTDGASVASTITPPVAWQPVSVNPRYNVIPLMLGTLKVTLIAMLIGTPLALAAALYTSEFAPARLREWIKPAIELLAGIPSVVMGFFALIVLATWLQATFGLEFRLNALNAGIALALAVIPIIYTVSEDALTAVPPHYREASLALGASKIQTAVRVVFPAAMPGIGAAMILGFGRAIGETMIVLMASGNAAYMSLSPLVMTRTLSATIAAELGEVVFGGGHYRILFFLGSLLFVVTSVLNWIGDRYNRRMRRRLFGTE
ncbi:MAG TPA: phosphate ABC transporter permease subunit PstC [Terriglobia bacterium]|nr:phosphate ABC transporter permease subunit PstC [Terriglobia bacterium]HVQ65788.1 phosphate ABC transporter permease subunit PstC [Terriglobia bacterium]